MQEETKAIYYGQVELIPGVICDGYVLNNGMAVMSERGTADLLGMDQKTLNAMRGNWPPKTLQSFIDKDLSMRGNSVVILAKNSPYYGRNIVVYTSQTIELLIRTYALAFINDGLRKNQIHIGKRAVNILISLVRTALDAAIKEACGFVPEIQKTAQKHYIDAVGLIQELGFVCSASKDVATKKDITKFLKIPESTLNSFLRKYPEEIKPIQLDIAKIKSLGSKAKHMNGYKLDDVAKITLGMDTEIGIETKRRMFGHIGTFAKTQVKDEIQWRQVLSKIFAGFNLQYNYPVGKYKVDFFVPELMLALECNGYEHRYYDAFEEKRREKAITERYALLRFHHKINLETLVNGILHSKPGKITRLYDFKQTV